MPLLPPASLILNNHIGSSNRESDEAVQAEFVAIGNALTGWALHLGAVRPDFHVLDVGCGLGRVARGFVDKLPQGRYTGIDIVPSSIEWCQSAFAPHPNFRFVHANIFSQFYNPMGELHAARYRLPVPDQSVDFVFSTSLFTHMLLDGFENYMREFSRVLKPNRLMLNTFYLLDAETVLHTDKNGWGHIPGGRTSNPKAPEEVTALDLELVKDAHARNGLKIESCQFAEWGGRKNPLKNYAQDFILARRQ